MKFLNILGAVTFLCAVFVAQCRADLIGASDVVPVPLGTIGSGNGTLDLRMMTFSGSEIGNSSGGFNGDNGNSTLPNSNSTDSFAESYVTTAGEIQAYYQLNFPSAHVNGTDINELVIFLDVNEQASGGEGTNNFIDKLDIVLNPATIQGSPVPSGDVLGAEQAAINQIHTTDGGTLTLANLTAPISVDTFAQGAGFPDYAIFTGIDPFSLSGTDVLLFNVSMSGLSNGAEEVYLDGKFAGVNVTAAIPEASQVVFFGLLTLAVTCSGLIRKRSAASTPTAL
ncbi:MAG: hypothetical protein ACR2NU_06575 [Aeoliella sp.]